MVKVLETDTEKLDDLEAQLEQAKLQYQKEKELNMQLLNSAQGDDDTGDEGEEDANSSPAAGSTVKVSSGKTE